MEDFNELLLKLQEVHDREMEGWQVKVQELSNKKGCDTKRMEELYSRNQQMKEQQKILTENIKTLENRLRAGLCDRCTVTQEVAKKRQQEFETLHLQSMQHITIMVSDINNLKKENKLLRDEVRSLRATLESRTDLASPRMGSAEGKRPSPDPSPNALPMALVNRALNRSSQPPEGDVTVKVEATHRTDEPRSDGRHVRDWHKSLFESYKPLTNPGASSWKALPRSLDRSGRSHSEDHTCSSSPPVKASPSSLSPAVELHPPSRHILHAPVPCRPQPLRGTPVPLTPWLPLSELPDWATITGASQCSKPRFPNLIPSQQHSAVRRHALNQMWHKPGAAASTKEPTVVFRLRGGEQERPARAPENQEKPENREKLEKQENEGQKEKKSCEEESRDLSECEGPLDLSDSGRSKPAPRDSSPPGGAVKTEEGQEERAEAEGEDSSAAAGSASPEPSAAVTVKPEESHKLVIKHLKQREDVNGKPDKKVPVLTISLRPVVVLESLNSAVQKHESSSSGQNSPEAGGASSSEEKEDSGDSAEGPRSKRKRESDSDRDSDSDSPQRQRKVLISTRSEDKSCS